MKPRVLAAMLLALGLQGCESCRPDVTLASLDQPRKARLVRKHELGSRLADRDHVVLEVELGTVMRLEVCEDYAGSGELLLSADGAAYGARCAGEWKLGRIVGGELFPDCAPSSSLAEGFTLPQIEEHAPAMFECVGGSKQGLFLKALERELSAEQMANVLLALSVPSREAWAQHVLTAGEPTRAAVLRALCPALRAPAADVPKAARAATLCPIDDASTWSARDLEALVVDPSEPASFVLAWTLLATMAREPLRAGEIACAMLTKDATNAVAALAWSASTAPCPAAEAAWTREPPCGRALDCDGTLCSRDVIDRRVEGARSKMLDVTLPRTTANWKSSGADGHAGFIVAPELIGAAVLSRKGPLPDEMKRRNARRHYAKPSSDAAPCSKETPPGEPCECTRLADPELDLCGDARWRDMIELGDCALTVEDDRARVGAFGLRKTANGEHQPANIP